MSRSHPRIYLFLLVLLAWGCSSGGSSNPGADGGPPPPPPRVRVDPTSLSTDTSDAPPTAGLMPTALAAGTELHDVGLMKVASGKTGTIEIDVGADVYSFTVLVYGHPETTLILESVEAPDGTKLVDPQEPPGLSDNQRAAARGFAAQFYSRNRLIGSRKTGAFLVPNTPDVGWQQGTYKVQVGSYAITLGQTSVTKDPVDRPVHVVVLVRTATQRPTTGTLNLTLHFTGSNGLTAATAPSHQSLQQAIELMRTSYGDVGVVLGDIKYVDIADQSLQTIVLTSEICEGGDLDKLLRKSADVSENNLNLFFVERFQCIVFGGLDIGQAVGGISGGIPGMPLSKGTIHSGVAVATGILVQDPQTSAVVMAHETGHFLGLYHTQENNLFGGGPSIYDIIEDTPNDSGAQDNLMYFSAGTSTKLTPGQGFVMHNNPWVKP